MDSGHDMNQLHQLALTDWSRIVGGEETTNDFTITRVMGICAHCHAESTLISKGHYVWSSIQREESIPRSRSAQAIRQPLIHEGKRCLPFGEDGSNFSSVGGKFLSLSRESIVTLHHSQPIKLSIACTTRHHTENSKKISSQVIRFLCI